MTALTMSELRNEARARVIAGALRMAPVPQRERRPETTHVRIYGGCHKVLLGCGGMSADVVRQWRLAWERQQGVQSE